MDQGSETSEVETSALPLWERVRRIYTREDPIFVTVPRLKSFGSQVLAIVNRTHPVFHRKSTAEQNDQESERPNTL